MLKSLVLMGFSLLWKILKGNKVCKKAKIQRCSLDYSLQFYFLFPHGLLCFHKAVGC